MPIKLNGATNGSVELDVPAAVGSDLQITLPATAGEVVVKDGSGNITTTGSATFGGQVTSTNTSYGFTSNATSFPFTAESSLGNGGKAFYAKHTGSSSSSRYLFYGENNAGEVFNVAADGSATFASEVFAGTTSSALFTRNYSGSSPNLVGAFRAQHEGVDKAVIFTDGSATFVENVGIGTAAPQSKLSVGLPASTDNGLSITFTGDNTTVAKFFANTATGKITIGGVTSAYYPTFHANGSEAARIDTSGRLLVGTTTEGNGAADDLTLATTGNTGITIRSGASSQGAIYFSDGTSGTAEYDGFITYQQGSTPSTDYMVFGTDANERMRITSAGNILIGRTNDDDNANITGIRFAAGGTSYMYSEGKTCLSIARQANNGTAVEFRRGSGTPIVGTISVTTSATSYNTSSDYRLKENVVDIADGITRVKQLSPRRFNFIADGDTTVDGFIAHEAQAVVPEAVTGEKDGEEMQGIDQSKLVPLLTAALQEAITKIETLEARVTTLEAG